MTVQPPPQTKPPAPEPQHTFTNSNGHAFQIPESLRKQLWNMYSRQAEPQTTGALLHNYLFLLKQAHAGQQAHDSQGTLLQSKQPTATNDMYAGARGMQKVFDARRQLWQYFDPDEIQALETTLGVFVDGMNHEDISCLRGLNADLTQVAFEYTHASEKNGGLLKA